MARADFANRIQERQAAGMAWAVHATTRALVYVGTLNRAETGLRCACICPACDAPLQAVNAGADANRRRVPFFRHHVGTQGPGCKSRVAELAALWLLAQKGTIEIPPPRRQAVQAGASGTLYQAEAVGSAVRERIVERRLVSEVSAVLTLESGRQVALVLRGHQDVGELGSVFAVIQVQVDDPEVALLSPEEIVNRSALSAQWLHVVAHEDHLALQSRADEMAWQKALDQLDVYPEELGLPVGATRKQASESLIHWAVKEALLQVSWLQAPELRLAASAVGKGGDAHTVPVLLPPVRLEVSGVTAEVLFDGYRADIVCVARNAGALSEKARPLLVEVAVTSKVKPEKLRLIQAADLACIELDVAGFASGGAVTRSQLRDLVSSDVASKVWLHHPMAAGLLVEAQAKANAARDHADAIRATAAAQEAERRGLLEERERQERERAAARVAWAQGLSREEALSELRGLLKHRWTGRKERTSNAASWHAGEFERAVQSVLPREALGGRVLASGGIAWRLEAIIHSGKAWRQPLDVTAVLGVGATYLPFDVEPWLGLLHMAIDECNSLVEDGKLIYETQRKRVLASLAAGDQTYARPTDVDDMLSGMFPELSEVLSREIGTRAYSERIRREERTAKMNADKETREAEEAALEKRKLGLAKEAAEREMRRLPEALDSATYQWAWNPNLKVPPSDAVAIRYLEVSKGYKNADEQMRALVRDAFRARIQGESFPSWFASREFTSAEQVTESCEVLRVAFLLQSTLTK